MLVDSDKTITKIIIPGLKKLINELKKISIKHKKTLCIGRSHGIFAEPTTFFKMLGNIVNLKDI